MSQNIMNIVVAIAPVPFTVMLILILIDVQYLQNVVFRFEKGSNVQIHSSSDSNHPIKNVSRIFHSSTILISTILISHSSTILPLM